MRKKIIIILFIGLFSCDNYLDIVPDQTQQIDLLFERKEVPNTAIPTSKPKLPKKNGQYTSYKTNSEQ